MLVILVLMATLGIMGVDGYLENASQRARDDVARTIFMAAQTSLTHEYNQDRDYYKNKKCTFIPGTVDDLAAFLPPGEPEKQARLPNTPPLVYLTYNPNRPKEEQPLYRMLAPYINDKSVLENNILIEFNRETGMMLSAFYSDDESVTGFGYGESGYDVRNRSEADLAAAYVGFYGVDSTGEVIRVNPIDTRGYSLLLNDYVNYEADDLYGLLTAEIEMPELSEILTYELRLTGAGTGETVSFAASERAGVDFALSELIEDSIDTPGEAVDTPRTIGERKVPVYITPVAGTYKLVFLLDGVRSLGAQTGSLGIRQSFPGITGGALTATLTLTDGADRQRLYSEDFSGVPVHAFYDGSSTETNLRVTSVRHLNNVRYSTSTDDTFAQTANIYMVDYERQPLNFTPLCNRLDSWQDADGEPQFGFSGTYEAYANCAIYDLHIDLTGQAVPENPEDDDETLYNAGLFDTILHGGRVKDVRFATSVSDAVGTTPRTLRVLSFADKAERDIVDAVAIVKGIDNAGGIAAINEGTIENCTMLGYVSADMEDRDGGTAGGIAGRNENGSIHGCATMCTVSANQYAGGIAGESSGTVRLCEAGTASWRTSTDSLHLFRSGIPYYGANSEPPLYEGGTYTSNNTFRIKIEESGGAAGGIVGQADGTNTKVLGCVNACKVEAGNLGSSDGDEYTHEVTGGMAGGIVGHLAASTKDYVAVGYNYNAGAVYATGSAGGIVGEVLCGMISCCYNTGYVNLEFGTLTFDHYFDTERSTLYTPRVSRNLREKSPNQSGGLLGFGTDLTVIEDCYNMQYAGDRFGGAFGILDIDAIVENCYFLQNIYNNTNDYYVRDDSPRSEVAGANKLKRFGALNMAKAPLDGNLDSMVFADGILKHSDAVGVFKYKFPTLARGRIDGSNPETLQPHRTPWRPTIGNYGDIRFSVGSGFNWQPGQEIIIKFHIAPPDGWIYLREGSRHNDAFTVIPLFDATGRNSLTDVRVEADRDPSHWNHIYGYSDVQTALDATTQAQSQYTFAIRARRLNDANETDAAHIAEGCSHEYELKMIYGADNFPNCTYLVAELYNDYKESSGYVDIAILGDEKLYLHDPSIQGPSFVANVLAMDVGFRSGQDSSVNITFTYGDGRVQTFELDQGDLNSAASSYTAAILNYRRYIDMTYDGVNPPGESKSYPFYTETDPATRTKKLHLVLWVTNYLDLVPPHGLVEYLPVNVKVEVFSNHGQSRIYEKYFNSWNAP